MNILTVHNYYQVPGGEDPCFEAETELLKSRGHNLSIYTQHNDDIEGLSRLALIRRTYWNPYSYRDIGRIVRDKNIEIAHFHNTFPLISPSSIEGAKENGALVVQTLHNYRLLCLNSYLARNGKVCELCLGKKIKYPGVIKSCYRNSYGASAITASMLAFHKIRGTYADNVDGFIALTDFEKSKLVEEGLPEEKIFVKPNFLNYDPGVSNVKGDYALFIGRLSAEKGVRTLLKAFDEIGDIPLKIVGTGPLEGELKLYAKEKKLNDVEFMGPVDSELLLDIVKKSRFLVLPSECYETFGRVIIESYACGKPVIVSGIGAMAELVVDGVTGLHAEYGNSSNLGSKIEELWGDSKLGADMGKAARSEFLNRYTGEKNYVILMDIYSRIKECSK